MSPPEKAQGPAANRAPNTATITSQNSSRTDNATAFGVMMDRPLTTTRTCAGQFCWCRAGDYPSPLVMGHAAEMARMTRDLRRLEVGAGVMGI